MFYMRKWYKNPLICIPIKAARKEPEATTGKNGDIDQCQNSNKVERGRENTIRKRNKFSINNSQNA
jgi:hypothetical protein